MIVKPPYAAKVVENIVLSVPNGPFSAIDIAAVLPVISLHVQAQCR
jgi:hypothetical protein